MMTRTPSRRSTATTMPPIAPPLSLLDRVTTPGVVGPLPVPPPELVTLPLEPGRVPTAKEDGEADDVPAAGDPAIPAAAEDAEELPSVPLMLSGTVAMLDTGWGMTETPDDETSVELGDAMMLAPEAELEAKARDDAEGLSTELKAAVGVPATLVLEEPLESLSLPPPELLPEFPPVFPPVLAELSPPEEPPPLSSTEEPPLLSPPEEPPPLEELPPDEVPLPDDDDGVWEGTLGGDFEVAAGAGPPMRGVMIGLSRGMLGIGIGRLISAGSRSTMIALPRRSRER
jgi:hypothetical protein